MLTYLSDLDSTVSVSELLGELVPPAEFALVSFDSYIPAPNFPSQAAARIKAEELLRALERKLTQI